MIERDRQTGRQIEKQRGNGHNEMHTSIYIWDSKTWKYQKYGLHSSQNMTMPATLLIDFVEVCSAFWEKVP